MIQFFDYAGVFVFAATGALAASRRQLDIIGFLFLASLAGIGGGTLRDLVLGDAPVFWVRDPIYILVCAVVAVLIYFSAYLLESRYRMILWLDSIGLSAYCVMGAAKGLALGFGPYIAVVTGILTATCGGILRDIVSGDQSVLMRREIYVTAALAGAVSFTILASWGVDPRLAALIGASVAFVVRGGALIFGWTLPSYRSRPGRSEEQLKRDGILPSD
ncbi:MAG: trimeric intracellular cation channel family protein [Phyllobacterium sp.]